MFFKTKLLLILIVALFLTLLNGCTGSTNNKANPQQSDTQSSQADSSQKNSQVQGDNFIFAQSAAVKLTPDQLKGLDSEKLALARNEIYARHGYVFEDNNFKIADLNSIELYNISLLKFFEDKIAKDTKQYGSRKQLNGAYKLVQNVSLDIDGDGLNERILCREESGKVIVTVNGSSLVIDSGNPAEYYAVVDIDKQDKYKELVLSDYGPSDDPTSVFCYYDGKNIINMGKTQGLYNIGNTLDGSINIDGSGQISVMTKSHILQTWFYWKDFSLTKEHCLQEVSQALYPTDYDVFVIRAFKLFAHKNDKNPTQLINDGQTLKLIGTDDQAWCLAETTNGTKGWIEVMDYDTLGNNGRKAMDTLAGLTYAD